MRRTAAWISLLSILFFFSLACEPDSDSRSQLAGGEKNADDSDNNTASISNPFGEALAKAAANDFTAEVKKLSTGGEGIYISIPDPTGAADHYAVKITEADGSVLIDVKTCEKNPVFPCSKKGIFDISVSAVNNAGSYESQVKKQVTCSEPPSSDIISKMSEAWKDFMEAADSTLDSAAALKEESVKFKTAIEKLTTTSADDSSTADASASADDAEDEDDISEESEQIIKTVADTIVAADTCATLNSVSSLGTSLNTVETEGDEEIDEVATIAILAIGITGGLVIGALALYKAIQEGRLKKIDGEIKTTQSKITTLLSEGKVTEAKEFLSKKILFNNIEVVRLAEASAKLKKITEPKFIFKDLSDDFKSVLENEKFLLPVKKDTETNTKSLDIQKAEIQYEASKIRTEADFEKFKTTYTANDIGIDNFNNLSFVKFKGDAQEKLISNFDEYRQLMLVEINDQIDPSKRPAARKTLGIQTDAEIEGWKKARMNFLKAKLKSSVRRVSLAKARKKLELQEANKIKVKSELENLVKNTDGIKELNLMLKGDKASIGDFLKKIKELLPKNSLFAKSLNGISSEGRMVIAKELNGMISAVQAKNKIDIASLTKISELASSATSFLRVATTDLASTAKEVNALKSFNLTESEDSSDALTDYLKFATTSIENILLEQADLATKKATFNNLMSASLDDL